MSQPKISGTLNNCGLHVITPEIFNELNKLSNYASYNNGHNTQYDALKNTFAKYYGFDPHQFSYKQFFNLLSQYNSHDVQIILGPVLREYMKPNIVNSQIYDSPDLLTELNPNTGRFESLSPDEIWAFIAAPLGFGVCYTVQNSLTTLPSKDEILSINIYHEGGIHGAEVGGHWERTNNPDDRIDVKGLSKLSAIENLCSNGSIELSQCSLILLQKHLELTTLKPENAQRLFSALDYMADQLSTKLVLQGESPDPSQFQQEINNLSQVVQNAEQTTEQAEEEIKAVHIDYNKLTSVEQVMNYKKKLLSDLNHYQQNSALLEAYNMLDIKTPPENIIIATNIKVDEIVEKSLARIKQLDAMEDILTATSFYNHLEDLFCLRLDFIRQSLTTQDAIPATNKLIKALYYLQQTQANLFASENSTEELKRQFKEDCSKHIDSVISCLMDYDKDSDVEALLSFKQSLSELLDPENSLFQMSKFKSSLHAIKQEEQSESHSFSKK